MDGAVVIKLVDGVVKVVVKVVIAPPEKYSVVLVGSRVAAFRYKSLLGHCYTSSFIF